VSDVPPSSPIEPFRPLPDPSWRERGEAVLERVRSLGSGARVALAVGAAVIVAVGGFVLLRPAAADPAPEDTLPRASTSSVVPAPASSVAPVQVVAQAAGAVQRPGVYRLAVGARVDDLVQAAGGFTPDADPDRVNLAAALTDGEKVYVPRVGELVPTDATADAGTGTGGGSDAPQTVDLNTASIAELDTLPGIGPATAQAILDYRTQHGRFGSVDDLLNVRGIGPAKLDEIRPLVRV
jgi:competence protein ComEA